MTNIFFFDYETRLRSWVDLRNKLLRLPTDEQAVEIDNFWQTVPLSQHYLHPDFINEWPDPWQLLSDNTYCYYARALGVIYTLLLGNKNIDLVDAVDDNSNEVVLVLVDNAKYLLNYWPGTVLNNRITDFVITRKHNISPLLSKIG